MGNERALPIVIPREALRGPRPARERMAPTEESTRPAARPGFHARNSHTQSAQADFALFQRLSARPQPPPLPMSDSDGDTDPNPPRRAETPSAERRASRPDAERPPAIPRWEYHGRWALVTGASMGIGEAFARALAARGMDVVLCARSADRLQALAREIQAEHGVRAAVVAADLAQPGAPADAWARASQGRDIHLLVNNAGFGLHGRFESLPLDRQSEMVALNCTAVLELAHLALGPMRARGAGGIINVASIVGFLPVPWMAAYAATKAFVLSLSQSLAEENRGSGLRILCVSPGPTPSGFQAVAGTTVRESQPGYLQPAEVVESSLAALEAGRTHVEPGMMNRLATVFGRLLPLGAATRMARRINEKR